MTPYAPVMVPRPAPGPRWATGPTYTHNMQYSMMSGSTVRNFPYQPPPQMMQPVQVVAGPQSRLIRSSEMVGRRQISLIALPSARNVPPGMQQLGQPAPQRTGDTGSQRRVVGTSAGQTPTTGQQVLAIEGAPAADPATGQGARPKTSQEPLPVEGAQAAEDPTDSPPAAGEQQ